MSDVVARRAGIILVLVPVFIWVADAFGLGGAQIPDQHFATIIWAGVSLLLGFDIKDALRNWAPPPQSVEEEDDS